MNFEETKKWAKEQPNYLWPSATLLALFAEIERLQTNQKALVEAIDTALEYFRIEGRYPPEERGFARLTVEGKLKATLNKEGVSDDKRSDSFKRTG